MIIKRCIQNMLIVFFCIFIISGCGDSHDNETILPSAEIQDTNAGESGQYGSIEDDRIVDDSAAETLGEIATEEDNNIDDSAPETLGKISAEEDSDIDDSESEALQEIPEEENDVVEIYDSRNTISLSDIMIAQVSQQELLIGNPILYDRFRIDGWVFEWLISDYYDDDNMFSEDGVLVVSREDNTKDTQIIHVKAEGGNGIWVLAEHKFEYVDVNFDQLPDLLICTGHHGTQAFLTYYCFLQTENGFVESPTFTDISNPAIDAEHNLILSQWRNSVSSHSWAEYQYQDNEYVMDRELCEESVLDEEGQTIWIWKVNDEEIGRSDELSAQEIEDLLYNENSEWGISGDRWRILYNNGLMVDYSIYAEP